MAIHRFYASSGLYFAGRPITIMLDARPNSIVLRWFDWYTQRALRDAFRQVHLYDAGATPHDQARSTVYVANHSSFWDGIVLYHLVRTRWRQPIYCMVDHEQVEEHPFFRRVGGFSVDRKSPRDARRAIDYAAHLLKHSPSSLVIFPQGKIEPNDVRPLRFEPGLWHLLKRLPATRVVPVALRYEFWNEQRGECLIRLGEDVAGNQLSRDDYMHLLEQTIETQLDELKAFGALQQSANTIVLRGKESISHWKEAVGWGKKRPAGLDGPTLTPVPSPQPAITPPSPVPARARFPD